MSQNKAYLLDRLEASQPFSIGAIVRRIGSDDYEIYRVMKDQYMIGTVEDASTPEPRPLWGVGLCALSNGDSFYAQAHQFERASPLKLLAEASE